MKNTISKILVFAGLVTVQADYAGTYSIVNRTPLKVAYNLGGCAGNPHGAIEPFKSVKVSTGSAVTSSCNWLQVSLPKRYNRNTGSIGKTFAHKFILMDPTGRIDTYWVRLNHNGQYQALKPDELVSANLTGAGERPEAAFVESSSRINSPGKGNQSFEVFIQNKLIPGTNNIESRIALRRYHQD